MAENLNKLVAWTMLMERAIQEPAANALAKIALRAGARGFAHIGLPYMRTDMARNAAISVFLANAKNPDDTLIMLDADHTHPDDTLERLAAWNVGVVGALAFRRGPPYFPCFFLRGDDGHLHMMKDWTPGLAKGTLVGTGAIAIQKRTFDTLKEKGFGPRYFQYQYPPESKVDPSEDIYFGEICEQSGIPHYCDTTLISPHITWGAVDDQSWRQWIADHPDMDVPGNDMSLYMEARPNAS